MFIDGIGISDYRSFGSKLQRIGPFSKINLFIGQNNSGKSNILLFLKNHYHTVLESVKQGRSATRVDSIDRHLGEKTGKFVLAFALKLGGRNCQSILNKHTGGNLSALIERVLRSETLSQGTDAAWFIYEAAWGNQFSLSKDIETQIRSEKVLTVQEWHQLAVGLTGMTGGNIQQWIMNVLYRLSPVQFASPKIDLIPAIRRIGDAGAIVPNDYSGTGIIDRLAQLQNPGYDQQEQKHRFEEINEFLRSVTGNSTAKLEIPYNRDTILVHMDGRTLPLSSHGTGIHEVIILASAATVLSDQVICIEEPELHLHPLLQKKLIRYLQEKTDNQYFISTHSAHLLDTPDAAIFHIRYQHGESSVDPVYTTTEKSLICADLGYRASDLLQANCVIWVEGPSDRIYLNHWIHTMDPDLIEGLHYSIMFYGGRLLSHLSALDPEIDHFISLRRLNRYISIVIDSDRSGPYKPMNKTKRRIRDEFNKGPGFAWITKGREIENYVDPEILEKAVKEVHPGAAQLEGKGQFDNCLTYKTVKGELKDRVDKVKVAYAVANHPANLDILDLNAMVKKLVQFIYDSNDLVGSKFKQ